MGIDGGRMSVFKKALGFAVIASVTYFLGKQLVKNWGLIPFNSLKFNFYWLTLSFGLLAMSFLGTLVAWQSLLRSMDQKMTLRSSWWVIAGSLMAKYLPGHIWAAGGRVLLCRERGIPEKIGTAGVIVEMSIQLLAALLVFFVFMSDELVRGVYPIWVWLFALPIPALAIFMFTPVLPAALRLVSRLAIKREVALAIDSLTLLKVLGLYLSIIAVNGAAFYCLIRSIMPMELGSLLRVTAVYNGAWAIGFISFITPGGFGVREGMLVFFLKPYLPVAMTIILSVLSRVWVIIFEVAITLVGLRFRKASDGTSVAER